MADNVPVNPGGALDAAPIATDEVGGAHYQRVKIALGDDGAYDGDVSAGNALPITYADNGQLDAFGRVRVSQASTIFDSKLLFGKNEDVWGEIVNGTATSVWDRNHVNMSVAADGDYVIRSTKMRFNYNSGKSHSLTPTFAMTPTVGTLQRVGYFNCNCVAPYTAELDGTWLEADGLTIYWVVAKGGVLNRVPRSSWNIDRLDGTGPSGLNVDFSKALIAPQDFQWLGVGEVRCGVKIGRFTYGVHEFQHAGIVTEPYMNSPNHSLRYEIRSTGGAATLRQICGSVQSEGGYDIAGALHSVDRGITEYATGANTLLHPLISVRLRADRRDGTIYLNGASFVITTAGDYRWALIMNPTVAGTDQASWVNIGGNSAVEYDISRNSTNVLTGGTQIASGYVRSTTQSGGSQTLNLDSAVRPGIHPDGTPDEVVLAIQNLNGQSEDYYAALNWMEPV